MTPNVENSEWSNAERSIAETALKKAQQREAEALLENVKERASLALSLEEIWDLNDFLSARRHEIDGKYDDAEELLIFTLSRLLKEGWLKHSDLDGIEPAKHSKIKVLMLM